MRRGVKIAIGALALLAAASCGVTAYLAFPYFEDLPAMEAVQACAYDAASEDGVPASVEVQQPAAEPLQSAEAAAAGGIAWPAVDWGALRSANPDVRAWVEVPGTRIDYAIVQAHAGDPQRYLWYDLYGNYSYYGCPYLDSACEDYGGIDGRAPIVYGHHLINGTMFSDFAKFSSYGYAESHRQVLLMTPEGNRELRVIGANVVDADYETIETGFLDADGVTAYALRKLSESEVVLEVPERVQRLYQFVCCSYETDNSRTIVYAVDAADDPELKAADDATLARLAASEEAAAVVEEASRATEADGAGEEAAQGQAR